MLGVVGQLPCGTCVGKEQDVNAGPKRTVGPRSCPIKGFGQRPQLVCCRRISPSSSSSVALLRCPCPSRLTAPWSPRSPSRRRGSPKAPAPETLSFLSRHMVEDKGLSRRKGVLLLSGGAVGPANVAFPPPVVQDTPGTPVLDQLGSGRLASSRLGS
jgi:hypothetical protein